MMILAIINGGLRDLAYKSHVGDLPAHQISTLILIVLLAGYFRFLTVNWPIKSVSQHRLLLHSHENSAAWSLRS